MEEFLIKMLDLGAASDQSCSEKEELEITKEAEKLYIEHIKKLREDGRI